MDDGRSKKKSDNAALDHRKEIIKRIKEAAYSITTDRVFVDFLEMSAITLSNAVDFTHREERERRYLEIINSYEKRHQGLFPEMFGHLVALLEEHANNTGPEDVLGPIFHELALHNKYKGQFFTPQHIADFMALAACGSDTQNAIKEKGFITMCEPCCGSGVMVMGMCKAMTREGLNYSSQLVVTAVDIDLKCVHMAYIQLALYGIPAVVIHGNSLLVQEWSRWYTPIYMLNGWVWRQSCGITDRRYVEDEMIKCASEPMYAALRRVEALISTVSPDTEPETVLESISTVKTATTMCEMDQSVQNEQLQLSLGIEDVPTQQKFISHKKKRENLVQQENAEQLSLF